jgi:hypothetical protein
VNTAKVVVGWLLALTGVAVSIWALGFAGASVQFPLALLIVGIAPLAASLFAFKSRMTSALLYFGAVPPLVACLLYAAHLRFEDPRNEVFGIAIGCVPFIVLGYLWSVAHRYRWPYMSLGRVSSRTRAIVHTSAAVLYCAAVFFTAIHVAVWEEFPGDCGYDGTPFVRPQEGKADFIARVVHVDTFLGAVSVVKERFWGLPWWSRIVLLKWGVNGEMYFVDGRLDRGILTRAPLPVVDMKCTGSMLLKDAKVELRLLRDSPHWNGVRIIGRAVERAHGAPPIAGARVIIAGPSGEVTVTTDADGIYDISGLPPGHYSVHASTYDAVFREYPHCHKGWQQPPLQPGDVWGCTLRIRRSDSDAAPTASQ